MVRTTPDDDYDVTLLSDVEQHGWHLVAINDDPAGPAYVFSVGIYQTLAMPEICIFGLSDTKVMGMILNGIGDLMRSGVEFKDWHASTDVLDGYSCIFRVVDRSLYRRYFGYALWYHEGFDFPMLQCCWPDKSGRFPWEAAFNPHLRNVQPVLAMKSSWPFAEAKNDAAMTTRQVIEENYPILVVSHDEDGSWQFLCGTTDDPDDGRVVTLSNIAENHPTILELADLPEGGQAMREAPDKPWKRSC